MRYEKIPLANLAVDEGKWEWNESFDRARVIKWWDVKPPSLFDEYSVEDQAYMIVTYQTEMKIQAVEARLQRIKQEADALGREGSTRD